MFRMNGNSSIIVTEATDSLIDHCVMQVICMNEYDQAAIVQVACSVAWCQTEEATDSPPPL